MLIGEQRGWREIFTSPQYRGRTTVLSCWLLGYAGLIPRTGAFTGVYMVDHGASAVRIPDVRGAYAVRFVAFQLNSCLGERIERRDVMCTMAGLFILSWVVIYLVPACRSSLFS